MSSDTSGIPRYARNDTPVGGPAPWRQRNWDWRAAANFVCGGAGAGLIVCAVIAAPAGPLRSALLLAATLLIATGLTCVWFEIGRPMRALNVFLNPFTSWMTREAMVAALLVPCAIAAALGVTLLGWAAAALALAFVFAQARMLHAAKGIPAWRDARTPPLIVATGLAEGAGLFAAVTAWTGAPGTLASVGLAVLVVARAALWQMWRNGLFGRLAPRAAVALDGAGRRLLFAGTVAPVALVGLAQLLPAGAAAGSVCIAGLLAAIAGAAFKVTLLGSAAYNQGFTLAHAPVRGARR